MLKNYFQTALRLLLRNKVYAFINIIGLSLGLACAMLIMLYVKDELSYDRFHQNLPNIYHVASQNTKGQEVRKDGNTGYFQGPRFAANVPGIESFVRIQNGQEDVKTGTEVTSQEMFYVDSNFFSVFSFPLLEGSARNCFRQPRSIVLSEDAALKQFGTKTAVGKTLMIKKDGEFVPYAVTAVARRVPENSTIKFDMLQPLIVSKEDEANSENWFNFFLNTFVVLSPGANVPDVEARMTAFYEQDSKEAAAIVTEKFGPFEGKTAFYLQSFAGMHLDKEAPPQNGLSDASNPVYSYILSGIALFILLIASINFINLTVARSVRRAKEIGIRKVVGSDRKQLIGQFLGESFLLAGVAFLLAIGLVLLVLPVFNTLANKSLALSYLFDVKLIAAYVTLFLLTGFLAGFYPALVLSGYNPVETLYSRFTLAGKNYLQKSLVVLQFTLASILIIGTFALYSQFNYLTTQELGYDDVNVVSVKKDRMTRDETTLLKTELLKHPGIAGVAAKNGDGWFTLAKVSNDSTVSFAYETVDEDYLPLLKIPILQGRNFSKAYPSDSTTSVLVNESFVKKAGWTNPIGQTVDFWYNQKKFSVIGVVKDYHFRPLNQEIGPQLFTMQKGNFYGQAFIKLRPGSETAGIEHITKTFRSLFPLNPYSYQFKDEANRKSYEEEAKWKQILMFGAVLTIFISCIGLFGLSVLAAEKRTKEIGIRKVLGASVGNIVATLSRDFVRLVVLALVIAIPIAWYAADKWLQNYPYRIVLGWPLFTAAAVLVTLIALATISFQSVKAALANPVKSLRTE